MTNSRRTTIIILLIAIFLLGIFSLVIAIRIRDNQQIQNNSANVNNVSATCDITFPGGVTGCISLSAACSNISVERYYRDAAPGTRDADCVGVSSNKAMQSFGEGIKCPRNDGVGCGKCVQYDIPGKGGVAQYTGDCPTPKYKCQNAACVRDDTNGTFTSSNCDNTCVVVTPKYKCENNACVRDDVNGTSTSPTCDNLCKLPVIRTCGESCSITDKLLCTSGSTCNSATSKCELDMCIADPSKCDVNKCTTLPKTAIISDKTDPFLFGFLAIIFGILSYRYNLVGNGFSFFYSLFDPEMSARRSTERELRLREANNKKNKKTRKGFEEKVEKSSEPE